MNSSAQPAEINAIAKDSQEYPHLLRFIRQAPATLYFRGDMGLCSTPCLGVVGARKATPYGKWVAYHLGKRTAALGITLVSGMAAGIDSAAHRGALDGGGKTIAVLGCGPDVCYPNSNREMVKAILKTGLILSEYPPGTQPLPFQFPLRNRIISGLSQAVVIVEAGISSGSLITAEWAMEQGREVYAVPGNINSVYSIGTNKLIQDGAVPLVVIDDFLQSFRFRDMVNGANPETGKPAGQTSGTSAPGKPADQSPAKPAAEKTALRGTGNSKAPVDLLRALTEDSSLGRDEKRILSIVAENGEVTMDFLCRESGKPAAQVSAMVTILEMKGRIQTALGKIFIAKYP